MPQYAEAPSYVAATWRAATLMGVGGLLKGSRWSLVAGQWVSERSKFL